LVLENLALRQQLVVWKRKHPKPRLDPLDKLFWLAARRFWPRWKEALIVVLPETVVRWHGAGFKLYWTMLCNVRNRVGGGRRISRQLRDLIFQMVSENPTWGAPCIHGELLMLGFEVSAIGLIKKRLDDAFGESVRSTYEVIGEPVDLAGAQRLAQDDPYQFQWWALSLVGARPLEKKKGADQGIDGRLYFHDEKGGKTKQIILSVKAGHLQASHVRDLRGVIEREKAEIGVLISMEHPTKPMQKEAAEAGFYQPPGLADKYPRIQILGISELLNGEKIDYPRFAADATFRKAPKARRATEEQIPLGTGEIDEPF
jgi:NACHT-associated inactive restriction endonuclease